MDVNLTISLMRGQMGAVIENAVNVAVETVLGEMLRVVGIKFEEFKREMNLKEKENENMRKMLEASRCQSKTMRKYIGLLSSKDPDRMCRDDGMPSAASQCRKGPVCPKALNPRARTSEAPLWVRQQMPTTKAPAVNHEQMRSESLGSEHKGNSSGQLVDSLLSETSDPVWGQNPQTSAETEHTDVADTGVPSTTNISEEPSQTTSTMTPSLKIKKEEAEVEIVCVTDEHSEAANLPRLEFPNHDLHHQGGEPDLGVPLDLPGSFHSLQNPNTTADFTIPHFIGVDPSTSFSDVRELMPESFETNECTPVEKAILELQGEMGSKINQLTALVQSLMGSTPQTEDEQEDFVFPVTTMEDLDRLELKLKDRAMMQKLMKRLSNSGGQTMRKTIWRICTKVFATSVARQLNWCGRGDKRGLRKTNIGELIIAAAIRNKALLTPTEAEAEKCIKDYLRYAPGRPT